MRALPNGIGDPKYGAAEGGWAQPASVSSRTPPRTCGDPRNRRRRVIPITAAPRLRCTARGDASTKLSDPHPVDPLGDHDLGMFAVADIAAEDTGTAFPAHRFARTPG